ncbi:MAG: TldD/PmbA family protein [Clostridia bacterium]|nr:TldD/PmbA family protein [Clostridia bacterium]
MKEIYDLGQISEEIIKKLGSAGAQKSSCGVTCREKHEFNYTSGDFSLFRTLFSTSLSISAIKDQKHGAASVNRLDEDAINTAVADCIAAAEASEADPAWDIAPLTENAEFINGTLEPDVELLFERTRELVDTIGKKFPKIVIEELIASYSVSHSVYANSNGVRYDSREGYYSISVDFSAHDGDKASSFFYSFALTPTLDKPFIELSSIEQDLADIEKQIDTRPVEGKYVGTVILAPGCLGELLGSALENFASDPRILDKTSIWIDKLGKQVASPLLTVSLSVKDDRLAVTDDYTSEGFRSESFNVIENGILKHFLLSLYVANKTGLDRAPNDGGACIIEGGDKTLDEIISGIDRGLIVGRFSGGQPAANGEFSGVAKNSFIIENGKITGAASETMISGNLADLLMNVNSISKETVCDGTSILPYIAFDGVTVSGK